MFHVIQFNSPLIFVIVYVGIVIFTVFTSELGGFMSPF